MKSFKSFSLIILFTILSISYTAQTIYTFAGNGIAGNGGDNGMANLAQFTFPMDVACDINGNIYVCDYSDNRIRKINPSGIISTFAGTGVQGFSGDGGQALNAQLYAPVAITTDLLGNVYIADEGNIRVRKIDPTGIITTIAGTGIQGSNGDGGLASLAQLNFPRGIAIDATGNLFIADVNNQKIRKIDPSGIISTFAGTGNGGYSGDGGLAINAQISLPMDVAVDASGNVFIVDSYNWRVRKINTTGIISTIAGTGISGFTGDGGPATNAALGGLSTIAVDMNGNLHISDNHRIRKINSAGFISTIAGTANNVYSGDNGSPINADLNYPKGICFDAFNNIYISDLYNFRVREICSGTCITNIKSLREKNVQPLIYPNPNNGSFKILIQTETKNGELILINSIGQIIYNQKISEGENNIITVGVSKGLYTCVLTDEKQKINIGKISIE
jgi:sugar lactone lactonase YvrE